jgi:alpha-D-ribose 1-methylphosphonate 5-triphosphate synthase subunit PhnG
VETITYDDDLVLAECPLERLQAFVTDLESRHTITLVRDPALCLTMVKAEDSLEKQPFYLGEALTSECEVHVDGRAGYGLCLGEEPVRVYCLAVLDALLHGGDIDAPAPAALADFIAAERAALTTRETEEFNHILRSQVDFKLMEQD